VMLNARWMQLIHPDFSGTAEMVLGLKLTVGRRCRNRISRAAAVLMTPNCGNIAKPGRRGTASSGVGMFSPNSRGNDGGFCAWAIWMHFVHSERPINPNLRAIEDAAVSGIVRVMVRRDGAGRRPSGT
jgi:hypothetical protein